MKKYAMLCATIPLFFTTCNNQFKHDLLEKLQTNQKMTPFNVVSIDPVNAATGVSNNTTITVTFNAPPDANTVNPTTFLVMHGSVPTTGSISFSGDTANFTPTPKLVDNTNYTVTVTTGVKNQLGTALAANFTATFQSQDALALLSITPADLAADVHSNSAIIATFNNPIDPLTLTDTSFSVTPAVAHTLTSVGNVVTFTPTLPLALLQTKYTVTVNSGTGGLKDTGGDSLPTITSKSFTTRFTDGIFVDISLNQDAYIGETPSAVIDTFNKRLIIAFNDANNGSKLGLFNCHLDGTLCVYKDISTSVGQGNNSGWEPSAVIDTVTNKLLVATHIDGGKLGLFICNLDGTSCAFRDISTSVGQSYNSGYYPSAVIDTINNKLIVATTNASNNNKAAGYICNLDGTSCIYRNLNGTAGNDSGWNPSAVIDQVNNNLLVVTSGVDSKPALAICKIDGTLCVYKDISASQGTNSGARPSAVIDTVNNKLIVAASYGYRLATYICKLDGTLCVYSDISADQGNFSGHEPSAVIDKLNNKLIIATRNGNNSEKPAAFTCNLDGTSCVYYNISAGQVANTGYNPSAVIDTVNNKLIVVTESGLFM